MKNSYVQLVENLKQKAISEYSSVISFDDSLDLYDAMINSLFTGKFDSEFKSEYLDKTNREEILELVRRYSSLCFYQGGIDWWTDSVEGVTLEDPDLVCTRIVDNYDYLIRIASEGGEDALKFLLSFKDSEFAAKSSIIDSMRNYYADDDMLSTIIIEMSKSRGKYRNFSLAQKKVLCSYPDGILFDDSGERKEIIPAEQLLSSLKSRIMGNAFDISIEGILKTISIDDFSNVIYDIYGDYQDKLYNYGNKTY